MLKEEPKSATRARQMGRMGFYDALEYSMLFHIALQSLRQNINQRLNSQELPHILSIVSIWDKIIML